ncbi:MAG: TetR/AcrR family transcriptional regulator [Pseudonocardia sp.]
MAVPGAARSRIPRRAPGEVRELVLGAARELFAQHGYPGTSTKRIAERAGVAEALLFRHFGSKAQLFRESVVDPLIGSLQGYADRWLSYQGPHEAPQPVRSFVDTFFGALSDKRGFAMALTAASNYFDDVVQDAGAALADALRAIEQVVVQEAARFGYQGLNPPVTARVGMGSVLGAAVLRGWVFGSTGRTVSDERITAELEQLMIHGVRGRPAR